MNRLRGAKAYVWGAFIGNVGIEAFLVFCMIGLFDWILGLLLPESVSLWAAVFIAIFVGWKELNISLNGPYAIRDILRAEEASVTNAWFPAWMLVVIQYAIFWGANVAGFVFRIFTTAGTSERGIAAFIVCLLLSLVAPITGWAMYFQMKRPPEVVKEDLEEERTVLSHQIEHKKLVRDMKAKARNKEPKQIPQRTSVSEDNPVVRPFPQPRPQHKEAAEGK